MRPCCTAPVSRRGTGLDPLARPLDLLHLVRARRCGCRVSACRLAGCEECAARRDGIRSEATYSHCTATPKRSEEVQQIGGTGKDRHRRRHFRERGTCSADTRRDQNSSGFLRARFILWAQVAPSRPKRRHKHSTSGNNKGDSDVGKLRTV